MPGGSGRLTWTERSESERPFLTLGIPPIGGEPDRRLARPRQDMGCHVGYPADPHSGLAETVGQVSIVDPVPGLPPAVRVVAHELQVRAVEPSLRPADRRIAAVMGYHFPHAIPLPFVGR